jgi:hypothetical protein
LLVLVRIRRSMGDPVGSQNEIAPTATTDDPEHRESLLTRFHGRLPRVFWLFAAACAATTGGLVTFAVVAYHLTQDHVVPIAAVPLIYAAAMGAGAFAALGSGWLFDRTRGRILVGLPLLVAAVPVLAFAGSPLIAIAGVLLWGVAAACWTPVSRRWGRPSPGLETRHSLRCVRRYSGCSRHRRWRHGRCTVRAITPHPDRGGRSQPNRRSGTADRNLATASTNPHSGRLRSSVTRERAQLSVRSTSSR